MDLDDLKKLGFTQEELKDRVVEFMANSIFNDNQDESGNRHDSLFAYGVQQAVKARVDAAVKAYCDTVITKRLEAIVGSMEVDKVPLDKYVVDGINKYLREEVNHFGKSEYEHRSRPRITWIMQGIIETHANDCIARAMKSIEREVFSSLTTALSEGIKVPLRKYESALRTAIEGAFLGAHRTLQNN